MIDARITDYLQTHRASGGNCQAHVASTRLDECIATDCIFAVYRLAVVLSLCPPCSSAARTHGGVLACIGGFGAEIAAKVEERCFLSLEAPTVRVTGFDTHWPYAWDEFAVPTVCFHIIRNLETMHD